MISGAEVAGLIFYWREGGLPPPPDRGHVPQKVDDAFPYLREKNQEQLINHKCILGIIIIFFRKTTSVQETK